MGLVKNIEEVRSVLPVTVAQSIDNIDPFITLAEEQNVIPEIGTEIYAYIKTKYDANNLSNADDAELLRRLQRCITYYAYVLYIPVGQLQISDSGIRIAVTEHFKTAFDWQIENLEDAFRNAGDTCLELVLQFLEEKAIAAYIGSATYVKRKKHFVTTADQFNSLCSRSLSRRIFRKLATDITIVQEGVILPILGKPYYDDILAKHLARSIAGLDAVVMEYMQYAIANLALSSAVRSFTVSVNDLGINTSTNSIMKQRIKSPASDNTLSTLIEKLKADGDFFIGKLKAFLEANRDTLTLYADAFPVPDTASPGFTNDKENGIYIV